MLCVCMYRMQQAALSWRLNQSRLWGRAGGDARERIHGLIRENTRPLWSLWSRLYPALQTLTRGKAFCQPYSLASGGLLYGVLMPYPKYTYRHICSYVIKAWCAKVGASCLAERTAVSHSHSNALYVEKISYVYTQRTSHVPFRLELFRSFSEVDLGFSMLLYDAVSRYSAWKGRWKR